MQPSENPPPNLPVRKTGRRASWASITLPLLVSLAVFLGGATQRWSQAIVMALFALLLIVRPPRHSLGPVLNTLAALFILLAATAFLPAQWFSIPGWRVAFTQAPFNPS